MTISIKNLFSFTEKISKMRDFQEVKDIEGVQVSAISANLYKNEREDLALFYFPEGANYAVAYTKNSVVSESIIWNRENSKNFN
jgi:glutamate N-acetyltransferase/amino-acid N-acetyltransferase